MQATDPEIEQRHSLIPFHPEKQRPGPLIFKDVPDAALHTLQIGIRHNLEPKEKTEIYRIFSHRKKLCPYILASPQKSNPVFL